MNKIENKTKTALKRQLSHMNVWAIAFGGEIGWGSFINPGKKFLPNSGVAGTAIAMVLGALVMIIIAMSYAIAPWAYVGFDTIPQAAEEINFSFKKVTGIMIVAIVFGCYVYISNNTVSALALANWPERVMAGEWSLLVVWIILGLLFYTKQKKQFE